MRKAQRFSVTIQHRWMDTQRVVAIAAGGWDSTGPGLVDVLERETSDPHWAAQVALQAASQLGLAVDLETEWTYGDWPDATAEGTGYSESELRQWADRWDARQPRCAECGEIADSEWRLEDDVLYCSESCAEDAHYAYRVGAEIGGYCDGPSGGVERLCGGFHCAAL